MTNKPTALALSIALAGSFALSGCDRDGDVVAPPADEPVTVPTVAPPAPAIDSAPARVRVSGVTIGTEAAADRSVAAQSVLTPRDDIIVSVRTEGAAQGAEVGARLTYQGGQVVGEETLSLDTTGDETTNIAFTNTEAWPAGTYTVQVMIDGQPADMAQQITIQ